MRTRITRVVRLPGRQSGARVRCPVGGLIRGDDIDEIRRAQIVRVLVDAGDRDAENDVAQVPLILHGERRAHAQILDVASAAGPQRPREPRVEPPAVGNVQDRKPAHHRVERRVLDRMAEGIAAQVQDAPAEAAALRQIGGDRVHLGLQFKRGDMAPRRMGEVARRAADAGADLEHAARRPEAKVVRRGANGVGVVIMPLVQGKQLVGPDWIRGADAERGQPAVDAIEMGVERDRLDRDAVVHRMPPIARRRSVDKLDAPGNRKPPDGAPVMFRYTTYNTTFAGPPTRSNRSMSDRLPLTSVSPCSCAVTNSTALRNNARVKASRAWRTRRRVVVSGRSTCLTYVAWSANTTGVPSDAGAIAFGSRIVRGSQRGQTVNRQGANKSRDGRDRVTGSSHWSVGVLAVLAVHSAASPGFSGDRSARGRCWLGGPVKAVPNAIPLAPLGI